MEKQLRKSLLLAVLSILIGCGPATYRVYAGDKDSVQPVQGLTVFDANGKKIGSLLGFFGPDPTVAFRLNGEVVILSVATNQFPHQFTRGPFTMGGGPFLFESSNCTGTPFLSVGNTGASLAPSNVLIGTDLYVQDGAPRSIIAMSRNNTISPTDPCFPVNSFHTTGLPWRFLIDLSTQFQPPFTMK